MKKRLHHGPQEHKQTQPQTQNQTSAVLESYNEYVKRLAHKGIQKLGSGSFSRVFVHPEHPNVAVKVGQVHRNNLTWLNWVRAHQTNPYVPKIYSLHRLRFRSKNTIYFVAFMEKLKPLSQLKPISVWLELELLVGKYIANSGNALNDPALKQVLDFLIRYRLDLDLQPRNFMIRGQQIVFTDPLI